MFCAYSTLLIQQFLPRFGPIHWVSQTRGTETAVLLHVCGVKYKGVLWNFIDFFFRIMSRWKKRDAERECEGKGKKLEKYQEGGQKRREYC